MRGVTYGKDGDFVDTFAFLVWLGGQVLEDVFEVGDGHVSFELLIKDDVVVKQLNLAWEFLKGSSALNGTLFIFNHGVRFLLFSEFQFPLSVCLSNDNTCLSVWDELAFLFSARVVAAV